ncbi:MAG: hypothetical protein FJ280_21335 [Planctomycetes bacterium]|nr:hypothetical protein [Planctomycetota bacterium]
MLTARERILATLRGEPVDRIAFAPRWDLWLNAARRDGRIPAEWRDLNLHGCTRRMGWGIKGKQGIVHREIQEGIEVRKQREGTDSITEMITPVGTITEIQRLTPELVAWGITTGRIVKPFITEPKDYPPAIYVVEHTRVEPTYEQFLAYDAEIGADGIAFGKGGNSPIHRLMQDFTDYEGFYYQLADHPLLVQDLLAALERLVAKVQEAVLASPALIVQYDSNYDDFLTPVPIYRRFFLPDFQSFSARLHAAGKYFATHADGHHGQLLDLMGASGFDIAEAFTTPPMTRVGVAQARAVWGKRITIWGGLASSMFSAFTSDEEFEAHVRQVLREAAPGDHFILGTGDNVPTDAELPRLVRLTELVEELGTYPLQG